MKVHGYSIPLSRSTENALVEEFKKLSDVERRQYIKGQNKARAKTLARLEKIGEIGAADSAYRREQKYGT